MYNLRYKILFFTYLLITGVHTIFGDINASKYYADYTREFLGLLGHKNPSAVPIRKMNKNDSQHKNAPKSGLNIAAYTDRNAIYLNEDFFAKNYSEGTNLFTCAHEAAHYVLEHSRQAGKRNRLEIEKEADIYAARMLCKHGYKWIVKDQVNDFKRFVDTGKGHLTDGKHPTIQERYVYLNKILKNNREK